MVWGKLRNVHRYQPSGGVWYWLCAYQVYNFQPNLIPEKPCNLLTQHCLKSFEGQISPLGDLKATKSHTVLISGVVYEEGWKFHAVSLSMRNWHRIAIPRWISGLVYHSITQVEESGIDELECGVWGKVGDLHRANGVSPKWRSLVLMN